MLEKAPSLAAFPETADGFAQSVRVPDPQIFPPSREESAIAGLIEAGVDEQYHAVIGF